jgi:hypothetical protein
MERFCRLGEKEQRALSKKYPNTKGTIEDYGDKYREQKDFLHLWGDIRQYYCVGRFEMDDMHFVLEYKNIIEIFFDLAKFDVSQVVKPRSELLDNRFLSGPKPVKIPPIFPSDSSIFRFGMGTLQGNVAFGQLGDVDAGGMEGHDAGNVVRGMRNRPVSLWLSRNEDRERFPVGILLQFSRESEGFGEVFEQVIPGFDAFV